MKKNISNARKYAKSLFQLATESAEIDKISDSLDLIKPIADKEISDFFLNPSIDEKHKVNIIKNIFHGLPEKVFNILVLLIKKNDVRLLTEITEEYKKQVLDSKNIVMAKVVTAEKLDSVSSAKIIGIVKRISKKDVLLEEEIDKSIIGGAVIKIGDLIIDGSLKRKIDLVSHELVKG